MTVVAQQNSFTSCHELHTKDIACLVNFIIFNITKTVCVHVHTCTCRPGINFGYHSSGTIYLILWARDWPWFTKYCSCLPASRPEQSACFHLPSAWVTSMNHHARLCACAISVREEGPSTGTEPGSEAMLGFPVSELEENRLHSFKQEREEGRRRKGKEMLECVYYWANRRNMQNRQRNSIFPGRFLINTNETWVIFPIKMNVFSKHVHW